MNCEPQHCFNRTLEDINELIRERTPIYRDQLAYRDLSHTRLTERCFVLQDWYPDKFILKKGQFRHVFRMPDPSGNTVVSCDCPDFRKTNLCFHVELVQRFGLEMMPEPLHEGEDPDSSLISFQNRQLFFSVSTKSASSTRHNHKRTIVRYFLETRRWKCNSCPKQT